ncbi:DoxX family protein [Pseudalgibacter alginicilyticus]|uniref:DoxX family protein n=1 Tax=Pseudalgibacter alginicilyticus TaxID=1736674 RepID=A0A0P0CWC5_9FLAO|nr:DoxX family protein [Pseudalgibacter alginicilyticus]ALJ04796.1 DoxX family protein [Pseudalgibacter alginicilyticus]
MNSKVFTVLRIILGVILLIFGLNKFLNFLPAPEGMSDAAGAYFGALMSAKVITLVAIVEVLAGLAFISNKYGALLAVILMSVSVNIILFHATLNPEGIGPGILVFILNIIILYGYRNKYKDLLAG